MGLVKEVATLLNALLDAKAVRRDDVAELAARHGLVEAWNQFAGRFLDAA
jgi:hypothetical protein